MSRKIHITLVGGQVIPIYQGIMQYPADEVILLHTADTLPQAKILQAHIQTGNRLVGINDAFDFNEIYNKIQSLIDNNAEYVANITGGTKIMSIALMESFIDRQDATIFYMDQNQTILDIRSRKSHSAQVHLSIADIFSLSGNKLVEYKDYGSVDRKLIGEVQAVRKLMKYSKGEWYKLIAGIRVDEKLKGLTTLAGSYYSLDPMSNQLIINIRRNGHELRYKFDLDHPRKFINDTQWFEIEVADILSKWRYCKDLYLQSKVAYQSGLEKNEIDIIINTGGKLIFVECKTQVFDIKDIDKFRNVVKNYGGLAAKAILITDQPINKRVEEKCMDNNITHICMQGSDNDAAFFSFEERLFIVLEQNLFKNNPI